jgi:hypothetical protein
MQEGKLCGLLSTLVYGGTTGKAQAIERNCGLIYIGGNKLRNDPQLCPKTLQQDAFARYNGGRHKNISYRT